MELAAVPSRKFTLRKPDRQPFGAADDNDLMKHVLATHSDQNLDFSVTPLLNLVEQIFLRAKPTIPSPTQETQAQLDAFEDKLPNPTDLLDLLESVSYHINRVANEIAYKCSGGVDPHTVTMEVLNLLANWSWDAKAVLALAAFGINYGEFWLLVQLYTTNQLAKDIALLKKLPEIFERANIVKQKFEALYNLIVVLIAVAKCIVEFKLLPSHYISSETPEMKSATILIPTAIYWSIRSIVACATQITGLIGVGYEYIASETWGLSSLAHNIDSIRKHLEQLLIACQRSVDEKRDHEAYMNLVRLFETTQIDVTKIIRAFIYSKDDAPPLVDCSTKELATIEVLRKKMVLLLISNLELSTVELSKLDEIYQESRRNLGRVESDFEVVWLPIVETQWSDETKKQFEGLLALMPWYSVSHPSLISSAAIKYIKEVWHFNKKPLLVVLDPQGKVVNTNAVHMLWIWRSVAYPFTSAREDALWREEIWKLEFLVDSVEPLIFDWIKSGKYICLCGGDDLAWIRKFSKKAKEIAAAAEIKLEILYVGKSNPGEKIKKNINTIIKENFIHTLQDPTQVWFFWVRLESMWYSKTQRAKGVEDDPIMQETMMILSFDSSDKGWALFSEGSTDIIRAREETIMEVMDEEQLVDKVKDQGLIQPMRESMERIHTPEHCNRLILPSSNGMMPGKVVCAECGRKMEKFIMYRCCTD